MKKIALIALGALLLAGCQTTNQGQQISAAQFDAPIAPGATRLDFNPDRDRWLALKRENGRIQRTIFSCKPLACEKPTVLIYSNVASPTRKPDPVALKALAEARVAKHRADGATNIVSRIASLHGYPAIWIDYTIDKDGKISEHALVEAFAGAVVVGIVTASEDRKVSKRHLDEAVKSLRIKDGGPRPQS